MANKEAKVVFKTATEQFKKGIDEAKATIGNLNGELKKNSNELAKNGGDVQLLGQRVDLLSQKHEEQASVVENMRYKLEVAKFAYGENAVEVKKLEGQLKNAEGTLGSYAAQLENAEAKLAHAKTGYGQLTNEIKQQKAQLKQLQTEYANAIIEKDRDSTEAKQLETRINSLNAELRQNKDKLEQAERAARELAGGYQKAEAEARDLGGSIGDIAAGNMIADFATEGIQSLAGLEEATRQYRNEQNKLTANAQAHGVSVESLKDQYSDFYAITADETMASTTVANLSAMELSAESLDKVLTIGTGTWSQFGDSIPLDGLAESLNESSKLGATLTGPVVDAINWCTMSNEQWSAALAGNSEAQAAFNKAVSEGATVEDAMNAALAECSTEQERQQLLIDALEIGYSDLANAYEENNEAVMESNRSTEAMMDSQSKLAEKIAPLASNVRHLAADGIGFLAENWEIIAPIAGAAAVAIGILAIALNFSAIASAASGAITALSGAMKLLAANPIVLVVAGLILIVTTIVTLWNNCESFRQFWIDLWDGLCATAAVARDFFAGVGQAFIGKLADIKTKASEAWAGFTSSVGSAVSNVQSKVSSLASSISDKFNSIKSSITDKIDGAKTVVTNAISSIKSAFNFSWSLPKLKLPHVSISGKFSINPPSVPSFSVSWYAKAMKNAMVLSNPTIFGYSNGSLLGAGEAGNEVVAGESHLMGLIGTVVQKAMPNDGTDRIVSAVEKLADRVTVLEVNGRVLATATAGDVDSVSGNRQMLVGRGLTL